MLALILLTIVQYKFYCPHTDIKQIQSQIYVTGICTVQIAICMASTGIIYEGLQGLMRVTMSWVVTRVHHPPSLLWQEVASTNVADVSPPAQVCTSPIIRDRPVPPSLPPVICHDFPAPDKRLDHASWWCKNAG